MFFCFGSLDINPVGDELLELGVRLLGGQCGQSLQFGFGFFVYDPLLQLLFLFVFNRS